jgi:FkbM family methyltransferase
VNSFVGLKIFKSALVRTQNLVVISVLERNFLSRETPVPCTRLGSAYGGWYLPSVTLGLSERKRLVISAGLGFDITFDVEMLKIGYDILALDPYPPAYQYAMSQFLAFGERVQVFELGLSTLNGSQTFFAPGNPDHDSWSSANVQSTQHLHTEKFRVTTIDGLFEKSGLKRADFEIVILKMDIEGAEEEILFDIQNQNLVPDVIAAELDFLSLIPFFAIRRRIKKIKKSFQILRRLESEGYRLVKTDNFNFTWFSKELLAFSSHDKY